MSTMTFDSADMTLDIDLSELQSACKTTTKKAPKSLQELKVHYLNFCAVRDLDPTIDPEELVVYCDKDQKWLDTHLENRVQAIKEKRLLARGKIPFLRQMLAKIQAMMGSDEIDEESEGRDLAYAVAQSEGKNTPAVTSCTQNDTTPRTTSITSETVPQSALTIKAGSQVHRKPDLAIPQPRTPIAQIKTTSAKSLSARANTAQLSLF